MGLGVLLWVVKTCMYVGTQALSRAAAHRINSRSPRVHCREFPFQEYVSSLEAASGQSEDEAERSSDGGEYEATVAVAAVPAPTGPASLSGKVCMRCVAAGQLESIGQDALDSSACHLCQTPLFSVCCVDSRPYDIRARLQLFGAIRRRAIPRGGVHITVRGECPPAIFTALYGSMGKECPQKRRGRSSSVCRILTSWQQVSRLPLSQLSIAYAHCRLCVCACVCIAFFLATGVLVHSPRKGPVHAAMHGGAAAMPFLQPEW